MLFICLLWCVSERRETVAVGAASLAMATSPGKPDKSIPHIIFEPTGCRSDQVFIFPLDAEFVTALTRTVKMDQHEMPSSMLYQSIRF